MSFSCLFVTDAEGIAASLAVMMVVETHFIRKHAVYAVALHTEKQSLRCMTCSAAYFLQFL